MHNCVYTCTCSSIWYIHIFYFSLQIQRNLFLWTSLLLVLYKHRWYKHLMTRYKIYTTWGDGWCTRKKLLFHLVTIVICLHTILINKSISWQDMQLYAYIHMTLLTVLHWQERMSDRFCTCTSSSISAVKYIRNIGKFCLAWGILCQAVVKEKFPIACREISCA